MFEQFSFGFSPSGKRQIFTFHFVCVWIIEVCEHENSSMFLLQFLSSAFCIHFPDFHGKIVAMLAVGIESATFHFPSLELLSAEEMCNISTFMLRMFKLQLL
jgi:hypothetical protein